MQITVRDDNPELNEHVVQVGDGLVRFEADDHRVADWRGFFRENRHKFFAGDLRQMWGKGYARDATEAESFAIGQLTYLEQKAFLRWYTPPLYREVLGPCIDYSAGPWAKSINYKVKDRVGIGRRIAPGSTDMPMVDESYALVNVPVEMGGIGYDYTVEDLVTSSFLGQPLPENKQADAIEAYDRHMNVVMLQGELNFKGFYANSGVTAANRTSGAVWDAATADTIINDITVARGAYIAGTQGNMRPSKMIVPLSTETVLDKPRATASDMSIREYVEKNLKLTIFSDFLLESAGSGSTKRVVFCAPVNDNVVVHIPRPIQFLAPQMEGLRVVVPSSYKYAGCEVRRVQTVRYMDGV